MLVDGDFVQDQYDISLRFRGSSNQRIIDMNRPDAAGRVRLWQDDRFCGSHDVMENCKGGLHIRPRSVEDAAPPTNRKAEL